MTQEQRVEAYRAADKRYHAAREKRLTAHQEWERHPSDAHAQAYREAMDAEHAIAAEMTPLRDGCDHTYRGRSLITACATVENFGRCEVCRITVPI